MKHTKTRPDPLFLPRPEFFQTLFLKSESTPIYMNQNEQLVVCSKPTDLLPKSFIKVQNLGPWTLMIEYTVLFSINIYTNIIIKTALVRTSPTIPASDLILKTLPLQ